MHYAVPAKAVVVDAPQRGAGVEATGQLASLLIPLPPPTLIAGARRRAQWQQMHGGACVVQQGSTRSGTCGRLRGSGMVLAPARGTTPPTPFADIFLPDCSGRS
jgi:hypothetical protein